MKVVTTVILIGFVCLLVCSGPVRANGPRNLRIVPGGAQYALKNIILMSESERDAQIEAIEKIHDLNANEAGLVLFARMAAAENESSMSEGLLKEWAGLLQEPVSSALPDVAALTEKSDLADIEAELVFLARRTLLQPEKIGQAGVLQLKCLNELINRAIENDKKSS